MIIHLKTYLKPRLEKKDIDLGNAFVAGAQHLRWHRALYFQGQQAVIQTDRVPCETISEQFSFGSVHPLTVLKIGDFRASCRRWHPILI